MPDDGEPARFRPGDVVIHRIPLVAENGEYAPVIVDVKPMVVVEDSAELVSLWLPAGTPTKLSLPITPDQPRPWLDGEWKLVDAVWERWNALFLMVPGQWRATWVWWTPEWEFLGWYVNLQEPLRRTPIGFDTRDLWLDVVADPDRRWRWKDEDDLARCVERGLISPPVAGRARAEGEAAIAAIERGDWPFTDGMRDWRPDPAWPAPTLAVAPPDRLLAIHDEAHWTSPDRLRAAG